MRTAHPTEDFAPSIIYDAESPAIERLYSCVYAPKIEEANVRQRPGESVSLKEDA